MQQQLTIPAPVGILSRLTSVVRLRLPRLTAGGYLFWCSAAVYFAAAWFLVFEMHLIVGDAWSRVGNTYYVLFSRDPHLGAIGFVWGPLPSLMMMPLVALHVLWPPLVTAGFASNIISILCMAGAVHQVFWLLREMRLKQTYCLGLAALFALHPMTIQYGANGDSEALFLVLLIGAARLLARWVREQHVGSLVGVALLLSLAYLTRYETLAAMASVGVFVGVVTLVRARRAGSEPLTNAVADVLIVSLPGVVTFLGWAVASWLITGAPFEQFTSQYGTSAQLAAGGAGIEAGWSRSDILIGQILGLAPLAPLILAFAIALVAAARRADLLAPLAILGSVLLFACVAWLAGRTGGWLRYYISVVPIAAIGIAATHSSLATLTARFRQKRLLGPVASVSRATVAVVLACIFLLSGPSSVATMTDEVLGREDHYKSFDVPRYEVARAVAADLDGRELKAGSVLIDTFLGSSIVLSSDNPKQFVITSDRDFQAVVNDPVRFGIEFILVPPGGGLGGLDAIEQRWPGLYASGSGIAQLVKEFDVANGESVRWRLYRVTNS